MGKLRIKVLAVAGLIAVLAGCAGGKAPTSTPAPADGPGLTLALERRSADTVTAAYRSRRPMTALHFARALGPYRAETWRAPAGFRWVAEGEDERIERTDGRPFDRIAFAIAVDYRDLPKNYAPFAPFSEGSTLVHSGHFHACTEAPCDDPPPLPITVTAPGATVGVAGGRYPGRARFVSRDEGTNIFLGTLVPVASDGFVAIVDPGLPPALRDHLAGSLPQAVAHFARIYGPLSFTPELYVSIDARPAPGGNVSTEGGVLPRQVFMHFDGADPNRGKPGGPPPYWLDWFFAHETAHLFQQDRTGGRSAEDKAAWLHEGGAEAMAALAVAGRGAGERDYALGRVREAEGICAKGLGAMPLDAASAARRFDLHYKCGLLIWLALDAELRAGGHAGLDDLNRALFAEVREGKRWGPESFLAAAHGLGASEALLARIGAMTGGAEGDARVAAVGAVGQQAEAALAPKP